MSSAFPGSNGVREVIWLALAVPGLSALAQTFQPVFLLMKWIGVTYLLYLAWKMWRAPAFLATNLSLKLIPRLNF
ncbi:LysE family transporter [Phyllobacterium sp. SB3]|uniref:LysE family transporter n=1 Tax=Phyllobacterium sp. SB3 TaxID=3156073 RepID=UPI0032AEB8DA